jgi:hypothetical protein
VKGQEGNHLSDIYSLGIVLYELLTGVTPFDADSEFETMQAHISRKPEPPATLNPAIPPALNRAILKALAKVPSQRFADANEFMEYLKQIAVPERSATTAATGGKPRRPAFFALPGQWKRPTLFTLPLRWKLPAIRMRRMSLPKIDRQYRMGAGFLMASLLAVCFVLFYNTESETPPFVPVGEQAPDSGRSQHIEIEPDMDMGAFMGQQRPPASPSPTARNSVGPATGTTENANRPVAPPKVEEKKKKAQETKHVETKKDEGNEPAQKQPLPETPPKEETSPAVSLETKTVTTRLDRQVVVPRGTRVDVILDTSYDYDSATNKTRVTLSVVNAVECSGVTVIAAGAKAYALLHKNIRRRELELEMLEVESVTGRKLKALHTTSKDAAFPQGKTFKINLEYNRIVVSDH